MISYWMKLYINMIHILVRVISEISRSCRLSCLGFYTEIQRLINRTFYVQQGPENRTLIDFLGVHSEEVNPPRKRFATVQYITCNTYLYLHMLLRSPITLTYTQISNTLYTHNIIRRLVCGFCALLASVASIYLQAGHPALTVVSLGRTTCPALANATLGYSLGNGDNAVNARGYVVDLLSLRLRSPTFLPVLSSTLLGPRPIRPTTM